MKKILGCAVILPLVMLTACEDDAAPDADASATGGEAAGEVLGGTISDDMLPLDELTSTSPPAERTIVTETRSTNGDQTTVETTVETTSGPQSGEDSPAQPEPPETPAAP